MDSEAEPLTDGGVAVGSFEDLEPDRAKPIDRNPSIPCRICGDSYNWRDYWMERIQHADDPETAPIWCDDCEAEIQSMRRRLSDNTRLTRWS